MSLKAILKSNAFWDGIEYFLSPLETYARKRYKVNTKQSSWSKDKKALNDDWKAIGNDFREVLNVYK